MSDGLIRTRWQYLSTTPMRDLLRGRLTARLDWRTRLATAGLPVEVSSLVVRMVRRTRLWRLERAAVADELIAHFADGVAAGAPAGQLVRDFGDERMAAKLIRRAKRRNRPLLWRAWTWASRGAAVLLAIYFVAMLRFYVGRPGATVDYVAKLNARIEAVPLADRAWPLWRKMTLQTMHRDAHGEVVWPAEFNPSDGVENWPDIRDWLARHRGVIEVARAAATKPAMGFVLGRGPSIDPKLSDANDYPSAGPLRDVYLPHLNVLRLMAIIVADDARAAAENNNATDVSADLTAVLRLATQLHSADGFIVTDLIAQNMEDDAVDRFDRILVEHPAALSDRFVVDFAHMIAGPQVASDMIGLRTERWVYADIVQQIYTGDQTHDGRVTPAGLLELPRIAKEWSGRNPGPVDWDIALPFVVASRAEVISRFDDWMDRSAANLSVPMRQANWQPLLDELRRMSRSPEDELRYAPLLPFMATFNSAQRQCERYLGERDGCLVAVALEIYRRHHDHYPATLAELTPQLLPTVPADRITGDPLRYRLVNGKPIVYSVGADRVDDGGAPPVDREHKPYPVQAARWDVSAAAAPRGDWVLYPPNTDP